MNIKWDANAYTQNFQFVHQYGAGVLELANIQPGQSVLDLGCGNGALTQKIADLGASVIGLDASADLLEVARKNYPDLHFIQADATSFILPEKVDVVFSNAVLHWIEKERHPAMLRSVAGALKQGGLFLFECGGYKNNQKIHTALQQAFVKRGLAYQIPFYFPTIGESSAMMEAAGFCVQYAKLYDRMTPLVGEDGLVDWMKLFLVKPFEQVAPDLKEEILQEAAATLKPELYTENGWFADYVRLCCMATREKA